MLEWGEQFQDELADEYLSITISRDGRGPELRSIVLEPHGGRAERLAEAIDSIIATRA